MENLGRHIHSFVAPLMPNDPGRRGGSSTAVCFDPDLLPRGSLQYWVLEPLRPDPQGGETGAKF